MEGSFEHDPPRLRVAAGERPAAGRGSPVEAAYGGSPVEAADGGGPVEGVLDEFAERPELFVAAAFAGGFLIAQFLRLLRR